MPTARNRWIVGTAFALCVALAGCALLQQQHAAAPELPLLPSKKQVRRGPYVFLSDSDLNKRENAVLLKELEDLPEQVYRELQLPAGTTMIQVYLFADRPRYEQYMNAHFKNLPSRRAFFMARSDRLLDRQLVRGEQLHRELGQQAHRRTPPARDVPSPRQPRRDRRDLGAPDREPAPVEGPAEREPHVLGPEPAAHQHLALVRQELERQRQGGGTPGRVDDERHARARRGRRTRPRGSRRRPRRGSRTARPSPGGRDADRRRARPRPIAAASPPSARRPARDRGRRPAPRPAGPHRARPGARSRPAGTAWRRVRPRPRPPPRRRRAP